jgi:hypothetical protein
LIIGVERHIVALTHQPPATNLYGCNLLRSINTQLPHSVSIQKSSCGLALAEDAIDHTIDDRELVVTLYHYTITVEIHLL